MSIVSIAFYLIGAFAVAAVVILPVVFVAEMFRSMHAIREHCSLLEKELNAMKDDHEKRVSESIKSLNERCSTMEEDQRKQIAGMSLLQERNDTTEKNIDEIYECLGLIDGRLVEMKDRVSETEKIQENVKRIDLSIADIKSKMEDIIECMCLLQERVEATEESTQQLDAINKCIGMLHELAVDTEEKVLLLEIETNKMRNNTRVLPTLNNVDFNKNYQFGF